MTVSSCQSAVTFRRFLPPQRSTAAMSRTVLNVPFKVPVTFERPARGR